ncbi:uncharacterized protein LAJ45_11474 [Morchella importuna]|uniref:uncharacterized protein n=1 Tax=Morchella importuna TaxID=1174673 RepID=UPI001E8CAD97|nr:uncharacterized protein LAJ45_11474 [Morchella importuna]KAH8144499.1 hypothetical protein LAJ45_11474 [Morchella importuna]
MFSSETNRSGKDCPLRCLMTEVFRATSASSPITQGAAPTSWWAFCATSAQRVRHRQSTTFAPGSAAGPSNSLGPPGDMAHVRRALANALVAWAAMRFPPPGDARME